MLQDPLIPEASNVRGIDDGGPYADAMGQTGVETVAIIDLPGQLFGGLNKRIARVAITYVKAT